jgi:serine/threonine protein kinase
MGLVVEIFGNISKKFMKEKDVQSQLGGGQKFPGPWQVGDWIRLFGYAYQVREIKGGGMGQIYVCIQEENATPIVLKTFQEKYLSREDVVDRFRWETEVWVKLGRHKNIVRAHGTDTSLGYTFAVVEYVVGDEYYGPDLSGWIRKGGLSIPLALDFACQFCRGMIHAKEIFGKDPSLKPPFVHRDIKPQNIMVTRDRVVKVTDFGLVKAFDLLEGDIETEGKNEFGEREHTFTKKGEVCGTLPYIAPEIWLKIEPDERADIYSFGCVLYEMFYGIPPFVYSAEGQEVYEKYRDAHLNLLPRPIREVPERINEVILKCLAKERDERYQDFKVLRDALAELNYQQTGERLVFGEETEVEWQASDWRDKGIGLMDLGFYQEATECYNQSLRLNPNFAFAYNDRGIAYKELGQYEQAIKDYNAAISLNPTFTSPYINRGNVYYDLGQYEQAIKDYDEAIRLNPKYADAYNNRGTAYSDLGQYERAIPDYDEAIRLNPKYADAYTNRGAIYSDLGQYESAISDYDEAIRLNPKESASYYNRAKAYEKLGRPNQVVEDYKKFIGLASAHYDQYVEQAKQKIKELSNEEVRKS